ncbi:MAG: hypothetical protein P0S94_00735 [Simkaniaceae bacterium]|nr:hypothetical protein [Simkaniaceae bacterium]
MITLETAIRSARNAIISVDEITTLQTSKATLERFLDTISHPSIGTLHGLLSRKISLLTGQITIPNLTTDLVKMKFTAIRSEITFLHTCLPIGDAISSNQIVSLYNTFNKLIQDLSCLPMEYQKDFLKALNHTYMQLNRLTHLKAKSISTDEIVINIVALHTQNTHLFTHFPKNKEAITRRSEILSRNVQDIRTTIKEMPDKNHQLFCLYYLYAVCDAFTKQAMDNSNTLPEVFLKSIKLQLQTTIQYTSQVTQNDEPTHADLTGALDRVERKLNELLQISEVFTLTPSQKVTLLSYTFQLKDRQHDLEAKLLMHNETIFLAEMPTAETTPQSTTPATENSTSPFIENYQLHLPESEETLFEAFDIHELRRGAPQ